ncbi:hypothetical protein H0N76_08010 [Bacillus cytotoxicus]|nr:hypothetical protein [Bacillus cytotoxicus]NZD32644.1 hypothetical protein [Bacillus cytotoxicus]
MKKQLQALVSNLRTEAMLKRGTAIKLLDQGDECEYERLDVEQQVMDGIADKIEQILEGEENERN